MCYIMGWIVKKTKLHTFHRIRRSTTLKLCSLHFNLLTRIIVFINPRTVILMRTNTAYSDAVTWENERLFAIICYILWTMCKAVCIWTACTDCARSPNMCCSLRVCANKHPRWPATVEKNVRLRGSRSCSCKRQCMWNDCICKWSYWSSSLCVRHAWKQ